MKIFIDHAAQIIEQAAKSPLGILALMILVLGVLAFYFFKRAPIGVKVAIFALLFCGVFAFAASVVRQTKVVADQKLARNIEGNWIEIIHDTNAVKYATVQIRFNPSSSSFELSGRTYRLSGEGADMVISLRSEWRSESFTVQPEAGNCEAIYTYRAELKEGPLRELDGFGKYTFFCREDGTCNEASGFYKDTQVKEAVNVELRRLSRDSDRLFSDDPGELIKRYQMSPKAFEAQ